MASSRYVWGASISQSIGTVCRFWLFIYARWLSLKDVVAGRLTELLLLFLRFQVPLSGVVSLVLETRSLKWTGWSWRGSLSTTFATPSAEWREPSHSSSFQSHNTSTWPGSCSLLTTIEACSKARSLSQTNQVQHGRYLATTLFVDFWGR